jgi:hypothetical protein
MLTEIKYLEYVKRLCWSNKVEVGSAVFITMRYVFLLLGGVNLDVVIFYRIWMPILCPLFMMHVLLRCLVGLWYVCFLELDMSMVLCVFTHTEHIQ